MYGSNLPLYTSIKFAYTTTGYTGSGTGNMPLAIYTQILYILPIYMLYMIVNTRNQMKTHHLPDYIKYFR